MSETSKQVANWTAVVRTVMSALEQHGPAIAEELEQELFPDGVPSELTVAKVIEGFRLHLGRRLDDVIHADRALTMERADDAEARTERDEAITELRATTMDARAGVEAAHGAAATRRVGLRGRLPDRPDALVQQAQTAAELLVGVDLGDARKGIVIERPALAEGLRTDATRLHQALQAVQRESREEQDAMNTRDALVAGLSRAYSGTADLTTGMALLVDRPDVADRVRPTARRRSGLPEPEDDNPELDPTGDPTPSDGPVPTDDPTGGDPTPS